MIVSSKLIDRLGHRIAINIVGCPVQVAETGLIYDIIFIDIIKVQPLVSRIIGVRSLELNHRDRVLPVFALDVVNGVQGWEIIGNRHPPRNLKVNVLNAGYRLGHYIIKGRILPLN